MPLVVKVVPDPDWKPEGTEAEKSAQMAIYKGLKPLEMAYTQAVENVQAHKGRLKIVKKEDEKAAPAMVPLEDRSLQDLKEMMLSLGVKTEKQMTRSQVIQVIRKKLDAVEVVEDGV